jgi:hypothetical protein
MADQVFRKISTTFKGGDEIWFRDTGAGQIARNEFFGVAAPVGTDGYMKYWTGSAWSLKPVKVWTGSAWVQKPVKFWNGSSWVLA